MRETTSVSPRKTANALRSGRRVPGSWYPFARFLSGVLSGRQSVGMDEGDLLPSMSEYNSPVWG